MNLASPKTPTRKELFISFIFWFCLFYMSFYWLMNTWNKKAPEGVISSVEVNFQDKTLYLGNLAKITIHNKLESAVEFQSPCLKDSNSLGVYGVVAESRTENLLKFENCQEKDFPGFTLQGGQKKILDLRQFSQKTFAHAGEYVVEFSFKSGESLIKATSPKLIYSEPGAIRKLFRAVVSKPLFNLLVFFTKWLPNHSFGVAIILLTLVVKALLFMPNQRALKSQQEMQRLQPKIAEINERYKDNVQMKAMKTMELYKSHDVHPLGSLLPMFAQLPFLIGTYLIVSEGISPHLNYLLYGFNQQIDLNLINHSFFWLSLDRPDPYYVLPILVASTQFLSMKLAFKKPVTPTKGNDMAQQMQSTMLYMMPIMIGFFTLVLPSGIGLYWVISTILGALQQKLIARNSVSSVRRIEA